MISLPPRLARRFRSLECVKKSTQRDYVASILVRVKNEAQELPAFYESLARQEQFDQLELIFLDSGSTDSTVELLQGLDVTIYRIAADEFSFGETCNLMMALATTNVCFFFSGHVILLNPRLVAIAAELVRSGRQAAAYFRQVPNEGRGASVYERVYLRRAFPSASDSAPELLADDADHFSNAASVLSRHAWNSLWFPDVIASEDGLWAHAYTRHAPHGVRYFPNLLVAHSHNEQPTAVHKRVYINAAARKSGLAAAVWAVIKFPMMLLALVVSGSGLRNGLRFALAHLSAYLKCAWVRVGHQRSL